MNAARLEKSDRLRRTYEALLSSPAGLTTRDVSSRTGSEAVHSDMAELRANLRRLKTGQKITCTYQGTTPAGRRVHVWKLVAEAAL